MASGGSSGWVAVEEGKRTYHLLRRDWKAIPRARRQRFLVALAAGWGIATAITVALTLLGRHFHDERWEAAEEAWLERIVAASPFSFGNAIFLESPGNAVILIPLVIALAVLFARYRRPLLALSILAAYFMMGATLLVAWQVWERDRPEVILDGVGAPGLSAFPSGHIAAVISVFGLLVYLWIRNSASRLEQVFAGVLLALGTLIVGLARMVVGAHWPSDAVGGAILGVLWLAVVIVALRRGEGEPASRPRPRPVSREMTPRARSPASPGLPG